MWLRPDVCSLLSIQMVPGLSSLTSAGLTGDEAASGPARRAAYG